MKSLTTTNGITLSIMLLASVMLVIHSLRPDLQKSQRRLMAMTGLLGLPYVAMELYWRLSVGVIRSWPTAAFYFAWHSLFGISAAMLLSIYLPKKVVLGISAILCAALTLFAIGHYLPRHLGAAIHVASLGIGLFIGASISSASRWLNEGDAGSQGSDVARQAPE